MEKNQPLNLMRSYWKEEIFTMFNLCLIKMNFQEKNRQNEVHNIRRKYMESSTTYWPSRCHKLKWGFHPYSEAIWILLHSDFLKPSQWSERALWTVNYNPPHILCHLTSSFSSCSRRGACAVVCTCRSRWHNPANVSCRSFVQRGFAELKRSESAKPNG